MTREQNIAIGIAVVSTIMFTAGIMLVPQLLGVLY